MLRLFYLRLPYHGVSHKMLASERGAVFIDDPLFAPRHKTSLQYNGQPPSISYNLPRPRVQLFREMGDTASSAALEHPAPSGDDGAQPIPSCESQDQTQSLDSTSGLALLTKMLSKGESCLNHQVYTEPDVDPTRRIACRHLSRHSDRRLRSYAGLERRPPADRDPRHIR